MGFDPEQSENIERVAARLASRVQEFCNMRLRTRRPEFYVEELRQYIRRAKLAAPDSPGRILRLLRQQGNLDYIVVSRSKSLYRILRGQQLKLPLEGEGSGLNGTAQ